MAVCNMYNVKEIPYLLREQLCLELRLLYARLLLEVGP